MMYRYHKNFNQDNFSQELCTSLSSETVFDYTSFEENLGALNKNAPLKKKVLRANHASYVTKVFLLQDWKNRTLPTEMYY